MLTQQILWARYKGKILIFKIIVDPVAKKIFQWCFKAVWIFTIFGKSIFAFPSVAWCIPFEIKDSIEQMIKNYTSWIDARFCFTNSLKHRICEYVNQPFWNWTSHKLRYYKFMKLYIITIILKLMSSKVKFWQNLSYLFCSRKITPFVFHSR